MKEDVLGRDQVVFEGGKLVVLAEVLIPQEFPNNVGKAIPSPL